MLAKSDSHQERPKGEFLHPPLRRLHSGNLSAMAKLPATLCSADIPLAQGCAGLCAPFSAFLLKSRSLRSAVPHFLLIFEIPFAQASRTSFFSLFSKSRSLRLAVPSIFSLSSKSRSLRPAAPHFSLYLRNPLRSGPVPSSPARHFCRYSHRK